VLAVSLDGSPNDHFPDALPDNGVSKLLTNSLGLDRVPALFMVKRDQSASYLVSSGVLSLEDMLNRIQTLALSKPGESLFGGAQVANSVQKTTIFLPLTPFPRLPQQRLPPIRPFNPLQP
jgi:conjugal transfer pilus assembly protein TraF